MSVECMCCRECLNTGFMCGDGGGEAIYKGNQ